MILVLGGLERTRKFLEQCTIFLDITQAHVFLYPLVTQLCQRVRSSGKL